uniref:Uncharacterized protein n=1 Tax=Pseudomonas phage Pavpe01 TaxID=3138545 RepID=A0AAU6W0Q5_9VIRU
MGQGTDSCGGYEVEYDPYDDDHIANGQWTQRNGVTISLSSMSLRHLYNAREVARKAARRATFTDTSDKWDAWADSFTAEIERRETKPGLSQYKQVNNRITRAEQFKGLPPGTYVVSGEASAHLAAQVASQLMRTNAPAPRGTMIEMICHCGEPYAARLADLNRGWGLSCSVRCASIRKAYHKPAATRKDGRPLPKRKSKR